MILQMSKVPVLEKAVDYLPSMAGQRFMLGDGEHCPDWLGLGILAGWTVALLAAGYLVLRERDA
ncbi:ABC transporter [Streptomyces badius]